MSLLCTSVILFSASAEVLHTRLKDGGLETIVFDEDEERGIDNHSMLQVAASVEDRNTPQSSPRSSPESSPTGRKSETMPVEVNHGTGHHAVSHDDYSAEVMIGPNMFKIERYSERDGQPSDLLFRISAWSGGAAPHATTPPAPFDPRVMPEASPYVLLKESPDDVGQIVFYSLPTHFEQLKVHLDLGDESDVRKCAVAQTLWDDDDGSSSSEVDSDESSETIEVVCMDYMVELVRQVLQDGTAAHWNAFLEFQLTDEMSPLADVISNPPANIVVIDPLAKPAPSSSSRPIIPKYADYDDDDAYKNADEVCNLAHIEMIFGRMAHMDLGYGSDDVMKHVNIFVKDWEDRVRFFGEYEEDQLVLTLHFNPDYVDKAGIPSHILENDELKKTLDHAKEQTFPIPETTFARFKFSEPGYMEIEEINYNGDFTVREMEQITGMDGKFVYNVFKFAIKLGFEIVGVHSIIAVDYAAMRVRDLTNQLVKLDNRVLSLAKNTVPTFYGSIFHFVPDMENFDKVPFDKLEKQLTDDVQILLEGIPTLKSQLLDAVKKPFAKSKSGGYTNEKTQQYIEMIEHSEEYALDPSIINTIKAQMQELQTVCSAEGMTVKLCVRKLSAKVYKDYIGPFAVEILRDMFGFIKEDQPIEQWKRYHNGILTEFLIDPANQRAIHDLGFSSERVDDIVTNLDLPRYDVPGFHAGDYQGKVLSSEQYFNQHA